MCRSCISVATLMRAAHPGGRSLASFIDIGLFEPIRRVLEMQRGGPLSAARVGAGDHVDVAALVAPRARLGGFCSPPEALPPPLRAWSGAKGAAGPRARRAVRHP